MSNQARTQILKILKCVINQPFNVCWCGDPWYQTKGNILHLTDKGTTDYIQQIALHEATHLILGRGGHDVVFWERFEPLVLEHLGVTLNEHQEKMKSDYLNAVTFTDR